MISTDRKAAFVELCKFFLGMNHIPGSPAGFNPSPDNEIICLDMVVNFPVDLIYYYIDQSDQGGLEVRSLRHLAHGVVNEFYNRPMHALCGADEGKYKKIISHIEDWKKQFKRF